MGNNTVEAVLHGANAMRFDKLWASEHDGGFNNGLKLWILALTLSVAHSQQWYSPACGSFCFLCRSQSARSSQNDYAGDTSLSFVQDGNMQSDICSLMYVLSFFLRQSTALRNATKWVYAGVGAFEDSFHFHRQPSGHHMARVFRSGDLQTITVMVPCALSG